MLLYSNILNSSSLSVISDMDGVHVVSDIALDGSINSYISQYKL